MQEIPTYQKAIIVETLGENPKVKLVSDYPVPVPQKGELLVRLTSSGICHSDISVLNGHWGFFQTSKVGGHEGVGFIVKLGEGVDAKAFPLGTKVGVSLISNPCRNCYACGLTDGEVFCKNSSFYGTDIDGTWQQYVIIKESYVILLPENLTIEQMYYIGPMLCGGVTAYKAIKASEKHKGQTIVITGAGGGLGSFGIQYAKAMSLRVIAVDSGEEKKRFTQSLGADIFIDYENSDVPSKVLEATDMRGADAAIMFAPNEKSYNESVDYLALQGVLVCVGIPRVDSKFKFSPSKLIYAGKKVIGSFIGTRSDIIEAIKYFTNGQVKPSVEVKSMDDIQELLEQMLAGFIQGRIVLDLN
ncbi:uncharacterized protein PRCAT00001464001 [Priceomyces carsonii]|uniref:uncharacterized protein n=1 Tax=Priceomyces carsonii TaxID=28549 RepID=UPI002EDB4752|nr:unnamed protein product [Priceomyces carsonii]